MSSSLPPSIRACATCGAAVDPLRAPVVALIRGQFAYFCSQTCRDAANDETTSTSRSSSDPPKVRRETGEFTGRPSKVAAAADRGEPGGRQHLGSRGPTRSSERTEQSTQLQSSRSSPPHSRAKPPANAEWSQTPPPVIVADTYQPEDVAPHETAGAPDETAGTPDETAGVPTTLRAVKPAASRSQRRPPKKLTQPERPILAAESSRPTKTQSAIFHVPAETSFDGDISPPPSLSRVTQFSLASLPAPHSAWSSRGVGGRLIRLSALILAAAAVALSLIEATEGVRRLILATMATGFMVVLWLLPFVPRGRVSALQVAVDAQLGAPLSAAIGSALGCIAVTWALRLGGRGGFATAASATTWIVLAAALAEWVAEWSSRSTIAEAHEMLAALERTDTPPEGLPEVGSLISLRPGVVVHEDVRLISGAISAELWGDSSLCATRQEGGYLPAGMFVRSGEATARVVATGRQRAFVRLLADALERPDHAAPAVRALQRIAPVAAASVVAVALVIGFLSKGKLGPTAAAAVVAGASMLIAPARRLAIRDQLRGILSACRKGVAFRDAAAFNRAGFVRGAVFCTRTTLLADAPDGFDVESLGGFPPLDVIALAAGAEKDISHPIARAIVQAAATRNVRPMEVRNLFVNPGLGIRAELPNGVTIVIGSRALMLMEGVATAEVEDRVTELERAGRDVVLVARDGRLVGFFAFVVPLRRGALAAMQRLHDLDVDPVLLSASARERLLSIARALDVEHVRPEVSPAERTTEVKRISLSSGPVCVVGHTVRDNNALAGADLEIAYEDAGSGEPREIGLAHGRLDIAVDVLAIAQATRAKVAATLWVGLCPAVLVALPVAFGLLRASLAPLAALAGTLALIARDLVAAALPEGERTKDDTVSPDTADV